MFKRSNSVDLFTNKVMDFMTDDYVLVDKEETVKSSIEKLRTEKKSTIVVEEIRASNWNYYSKRHPKKNCIYFKRLNQSK
jgi:hypothetical protein